MEQKPSNKDRLLEITSQIEQGIQELFTSEKYCNYLRTMSRFHRYSVNNTMLIYMQRPDATLVAGYGKWRDQFKRNVMRGEKGIRIIAPAPYKKTILAEKLDPLTRTPMKDGSGKTVTEEREITIPMFKPVTVFDISQTEGEPLPELVEALTGDVKEFSTFMEALRRSSPVPICMEDMPQFMDGYFQMKEQRIAIRKGMSEVQTIAAAIHEIAHAKLHDNTKTQIGERKDQRTAEVEAESIAYAVCAYYDIHTEANSFGYIASWSKGKDLQTLRDSLETINNTCSELIDDIDRHFAEIVKEAEKDMPDPSVSNNSMSFARQNFTLFHELHHLISNTSGAEIIRDDFYVYLNDQQTQSEKQCDVFANAFLVPLDDFTIELEKAPIDEDRIADLAILYSVSKEAIMYKLLAMRKITHADYDILKETFYGDALRNLPRKEKDSGGGNYYLTKLSYLGQRYAGDVFKEYFSGRIDNVRASEMLNSKIDHLPKLESAYFRGLK